MSKRNRMKGSLSSFFFLFPFSFLIFAYLGGGVGIMNHLSMHG